MGIVRYLACLAEVDSDARGAITALADGLESIVYVGTSHGFVMQLHVEYQDLNKSEEEPYDPSAYTTIMDSAQVSAEHEAVDALHCLRFQPSMLCVLCCRRVELVDTRSWKTLLCLSSQVQQMCVLDGISESKCRWLREQLQQRSSNPRAEAARVQLQPTRISVVVMTEEGGCGIRVVYVHSSPTAGVQILYDNLIHFPSPALSLAPVNSRAIVVSMKKGLLVVLLNEEDGEARRVPLPLPIAVHNPRGNTPLLSASADGDISLSVGHTIFSCSLGQAIAEGYLQNEAAPASNSHASCQWSQTRRVPEMTCMGVHYPFLFQFSREACTVTAFHTTEGESCCSPGASNECIRMPGVGVIARSWAASERIYVANASSVWLIQLPSLHQQWTNLVRSGRMEMSMTWCKRERASGFVSRAELDAIECDVRLQAGFEFIQRSQVENAMRYFKGSQVDLRDLLLLVPECIPQDALPTELQFPHNVEPRYVPFNSWSVAISRSPMYWEGWRQHPCRWNCYSTIEADHKSLVLSSADGGSRGAKDGAADRFAYWGRFKKELEAYLREHLAVVSPPQQRAAMYALLVLALERQDWAEAHSCCLSPHLSVSDAQDLLASLHEFRLLACLLWANGHTERADEVIQSRLLLSSLLSKEYLRLFTLHGPKWCALPAPIRYQVASVLLGVGSEADSADAGGDGEEKWRERLTSWYEDQSQQAEKAEELQEGTTPSLVSSTLPSTLSLEFLLLEHMALPEIKALLAHEKWRSKTVDAEGSSLIQFALGLLTVAGTAEQLHTLGRLVASAIVILVDAKCSTAVVNTRGLTCLDVIYGVSEDTEFTDDWITLLLSSKMMIAATDSTAV